MLKNIVATVIVLLLLGIGVTVMQFFFGENAVLKWKLLITSIFVVLGLLAIGRIWLKES